MEKKAAKKQANQQYANDMAAMEQQRQWDIEDRDEARVYSRQVYSQLVEDAEAAGFNPLTALRNGGGANYNAAAGMAPLSRKAPVKQAVGGSAVGSAFGAAGDFLANFDPHADQKREQEYRLIESQIASLNAGTLSRSSSSASARRSYGASDYERRPSGKSAALSGVRMSSGNGWLDPPSASAEGLPIWVKGTDRDGKSMWIPNPDGPDAEQLVFAALTRAQAGAEAFTRTAWDLLSKPRSQVKVTRVPKGKRGNDGTWWDYVPSFSFK